jgi:threonine synthase
LSCSIPCSTFARSRAIVWSNCASSGDTGAAVGATSCGAV